MAGWFRWTARGGFEELDLQIEKLRLLRDSYQTAFQEQRHHQIIDLKKDGERFCLP